MPRFITSTNDVSDDTSISPMMLPGQDDPSSLADPNAQFSGDSDTSGTTVSSRWSKETYRQILATDSDLYNQGFQDRADKPMDDDLAILSDDYLHGYDQAGFYTENAQESAPQNIQPMFEGEDEIKRNPVARRRNATNWGLNEGNSVIEPDKNNQEGDPSRFDPDQQQGDPGLAQALPPSLQDYGDGLTSAAVRAASTVLGDGSWFDGNSESILNRIDLLQSMINQLQRTASRSDLDEEEIRSLASVHSELTGQKDSLEKLASEYTDFSMDDYIDSLPGGVVAQNYASLARNPDLGPDDGSFLYREAVKVQREVQDMDWNEYCHLGAKLWVADQDTPLLRSASATKEAATYHVFNESLPVMNVAQRASIISSFVENVEKERASTVKEATRYASRVRTAASSHKEVLADKLDDIFQNTNWL